MPYFTELHAHTAPVSPCARQTAEEVVDRYLAAGYTSVVVSNHYSSIALEPVAADWDARLDYYLDDYYKMKAYAADRLHVILCIELRFDQNSNDYLIFGIDEPFLRKHPDICKMDLRSFSKLAHENGLLIVQAHPFRNGITVVNPDLVDGYEVFNGHGGHDSRNAVALDWCKRYGKIPTSGTDLHYAQSVVNGGTINGGIMTDAPITSMQELTEILRSGCYTLLCGEPVASRDGMRNVTPAEILSK